MSMLVVSPRSLLALALGVGLAFSSEVRADDPPPPRLPTPAPTTALDLAPCVVGGRDRCRPQRIAGIVLSGVAGGLIIAGAALVPFADRPISGDPDARRALRPAGVTLIGAGIFALCTGAGLLAEALARRRGRMRFAWRGA